MKIYSAIFNDHAHLEQFGECDVVHEPEELIDSKGILILHGGEDISPSIYGHKLSRMTRADPFMSHRDKIEVNLAKKAIELGIPIFGICRGAQLSCALAGGSLVQHVNNHAMGAHTVRTIDKQELSTSSCHHQMMNPWDVDHELLAWSAPSRSDVYIIEHEDRIKMKLEPEIVFFPKIKALAIQGHPEWMQSSTPFVKHCLKLVEEKLL